MNKLSRSASVAVVSLVLALAAVAPAAAAGTTRTVYPLEVFELPAGSACTFDVEGRPEVGFFAETDFSDGRIQYSVRARGEYVNLDTNATFATADTFRELDRIDPVTSLDFVTMDGRNTYSFGPGDSGPYGPVGPDPAMYRITGATSFTINLITRRITNFTWSGGITDVCEALS